jgi:hypothetical protein
MSEQIEPITPSEAARTLSDYRWRKEHDPGNALAALFDADRKETQSTELPSDELYGKAGVEASQGYREMVSAFPVKPVEDDALESKAGAGKQHFEGQEFSERRDCGGPRASSRQDGACIRR